MYICLEKDQVNIMFEFEEMGSDKISTSLIESGLFKTRIGRNTSASVFAFFRQAPRVDVQARHADWQTPHVDEVSSLKHPLCIPICITIWHWSSYRREKLSCRGKLPTRIFSALVCVFSNLFVVMR